MEEYTSGETVRTDGKKSTEWIPNSIGPEVAFNSSRSDICCPVEFRNAADSCVGEQGSIVDEGNDTLGQGEGEFSSRPNENLGC